MLKLFTIIFEFLAAAANNVKRSSRQFFKPTNLPPEEPIMVISTTFLSAEAFTKIQEGGWYPGDKPGDPNPTNFGVTQKRYDVYRLSKGLSPQTVHNIAEPEVQEIYHAYWVEADCDQLCQFSTKLPIAHFDTAFNAGTHQANKILQRSVGVPADGVVGPQTLSAVKLKIVESESDVITSYLTTRLDFLKSLSNWQYWGKGWTKRLINLATTLNVTWVPDV